MQTLGNPVHTARRHTFNADTEIMIKLFDFALFELGIIVIIRLKRLECRVLFSLHSFIRLIDGEVKLSNKRAIHPWFSEVIT